jgi:hypothetical protein
MGLSFERNGGGFFADVGGFVKWEGFGVSFLKKTRKVSLCRCLSLLVLWAWVTDVA